MARVTSLSTVTARRAIATWPVVGTKVQIWNTHMQRQSSHDVLDIIEK